MQHVGSKERSWIAAVEDERALQILEREFVPLVYRAIDSIACEHDCNQAHLSVRKVS